MNKIKIMLLILFVTGSVFAQDKKATFKSDYLGQAEMAKDRIFQLLDAMPADKFAWSPTPKVRTLAATFLHVAYTNYAFAKMTGNEIPKDTEFTQDRKAWDAQTTDKAKVKEILTKSYKEYEAAVKGVSKKDLEEMRKIFNMDMSTRKFMLLIENHSWEHLGQLIVYARLNDVVPPWSK